MGRVSHLVGILILVTVIVEAQKNGQCRKGERCVARLSCPTSSVGANCGKAQVCCNSKPKIRQHDSKPPKRTNNGKKLKAKKERTVHKMGTEKKSRKLEKTENKT